MTASSVAVPLLKTSQTSFWNAQGISEQRMRQVYLVCDIERRSEEEEKKIKIL